MRNHFFKLSVLLILALLPITASAHQPRIVTQGPVMVTDPEVSKAYYGKLTGEPIVYRIVSDKPFALYVGVLVPDIAGHKKDISAVIIKDNNTVMPLAVLDGTNFEWEKFFEEFGHDTYWQGPEYKNTVDAGSYEIRVSSSNNDSKYSLAIGEIEDFDFKESMNAFTLIPEIKRDFFNKSPAEFIFSPLGWGFILVMFFLSFVFGFVYRFLLRRFAKNTVRTGKKNIGIKGRLIRFFIGIILFIWAITTTWSPILLFFAGFTFFEALFSWCGFYAAIGKNSCPVK